VNCHLREVGHDPALVEAELEAVLARVRRHRVHPEAQALDRAALLLRLFRPLLQRGLVPRVRSHWRFSNRGTEYLSKSGMKWMNGSAKRLRGRALLVPRRASAQGLRLARRALNKATHLQWAAWRLHGGSKYATIALTLPFAFAALSEAAAAASARFFSCESGQYLIIWPLIQLVIQPSAQQENSG
jgi:hypothetical protein